jgi:hypothetical protein
MTRRTPLTDTEKKQQPRSLFQQLAEEFTAKDDPTGWFEVLYQRAQGNEEAIPWAQRRANPLLVQWAADHHLVGKGKQAAGFARSVF